MNGPMAAAQFGFTAYTIGENLKELTHEDSLKAPEQGGNCCNWVLGHILNTRNGMMQLLGKEPFWSEDKAARYARYSKPITDPSQALSLGELMETFQNTQEPLTAAVGALTDETLARPLPPGMDPVLGDTVASALTAISFHEAYHAGQLGVLRRVAGKPGGIA